MSWVAIGFYVLAVVVIAIFLIGLGAVIERKMIAARLRTRTAGLTIQAKVELKTIADELEGK